MARETSIETYNQIKAEGLLSERRLQVYEILYEHGPMTGSQVSKIFHQKHTGTTLSETVRNRITELIERGVVKEMPETVICPFSKRRVLQFDVTSGLPTEPQKQITRKERIISVKKQLDILERKVSPQLRPAVTTIYNEMCKL